MCNASSKNLNISISSHVSKDETIGARCSSQSFVVCNAIGSHRLKSNGALDLLFDFPISSFFFRCVHDRSGQHRLNFSFCFEKLFSRVLFNQVSFYRCIYVTLFFPSDTMSMSIIFFCARENVEFFASLYFLAQPEEEAEAVSFVVFWYV